MIGDRFNPQEVTLRKSGSLQKIGENEIEAARTVYLKAYDALLKNRTKENADAMLAAYDKLKRIKAEYREGRRLMLAWVCSKQRPRQKRRL